MPEWADLSDDELRSRLLGAGIDTSMAGFLVRERDNEFIAPRITRCMGGDPQMTEDGGNAPS